MGDDEEGLVVGEPALILLLGDLALESSCGHELFLQRRLPCITTVGALFYAEAVTLLIILGGRLRLLLRLFLFLRLRCQSLHVILLLIIYFLFNNIFLHFSCVLILLRLANYLLLESLKDILLLLEQVLQLLLFKGGTFQLARRERVLGKLASAHILIVQVV